MTGISSLFECAARGWPESNKRHRGKVREHVMDVYTQPPGHGSFTLTTRVPLCESHARWFKEHNTYVHTAWDDEAGET